MSGGNGKEFPLSMLVKAVDKATAPLKRINDRAEALAKPFKKLNNSLSAFGTAAGLPKLSAGFAGVGSAFGGVARELGNLGKKLFTFGLLAGGVFFAWTKRSVDAGDELAKTADRVGLTVDAFAQLRFVAGRAGITQEEFTTSLDQFNRRLGEAKMKTGSLYKAIQHTPVAFQKQFAAAKNNEEALNLMFDAMSRITDPAKRAAFAAEVFGKAGIKMGAMIQNGRGEVDELRKEYMRIAGSQERWARSAEILNDAMGDVEEALAGVSSAVMGELFPALTTLAGSVKEFLISNREGLRAWAQRTAKAITDWVQGGGIRRLVDGFERITKAVEPIVSKLGGWPTVLGAIGAAIVGGPLLGALASLATAFASLGLAMLGTPIGWFMLGFVAIAGLGLLLVENWEPVKAFFKEWFPEFSKGIEQSWQGLKVLVDWLGKATAAWASLKGAGGKDGALANWVNDSAVGKFLNSSSFSSNAFPAAAPALGAGGAQTAQIQIDISGAPRGTRVTESPKNTADVDLSLGVANLGT